MSFASFTPCMASDDRAIIKGGYVFVLLWVRYEMQDLHVADTLPQMVALSEAYMQIYEQQQGGS